MYAVSEDLEVQVVTAADEGAGARNVGALAAGPGPLDLGLCNEAEVDPSVPLECESHAPRFVPASSIAPASAVRSCPQDAPSGRGREAPKDEGGTTDAGPATSVPPR